MTSDNQDKDRLADLLSEMADGHHTEPEDEQPQQPEEENQEHVDGESAPEEPTVAPAEHASVPAGVQPAHTEAAAAPVAAPEAARERQDVADSTTTPMPAPARPTAPPRPAKSATPRTAGRARPSAPVAPVLGGDIDTPIDPTTSDVPVPAQATAPAATPATPRRIVPVAPPARPPVSRLYTQQQFRLIQAIAFKRTLIPILLTTGVLCLASVLLGWISSSESPFIAFRSLLFTIPMLLISLVLLFFGGLTMLQVKHDLSRAAQSLPPTTHPHAQ